MIYKWIREKEQKGKFFFMEEYDGFRNPRQASKRERKNSLQARERKRLGLKG